MPLFPGLSALQNSPRCEDTQGTRVVFLGCLKNKLLSVKSTDQTLRERNIKRKGGARWCVCACEGKN